MRWTIVTGSFSADHHEPYGNYRHGHDWHVEAAIPASGHKNGPQARLDVLLSMLDGGFLDLLVPDPSNEGVAEWLGTQLDARSVEVWRFDRGRKFGGLWSPDA